MFGPGKKKREKIVLAKGSWKRSLRIFQYFKPHFVKFGIGTVILIVSSAMTMLFPKLTGKLIDAVNGQTVTELGINLQGIDEIAIMLLIIFALQAIMSFFRVWLFNDVTEKVIMKIRQDSYKHIISLPMNFFNSNRVGELNSRISNDIAQIQETFTIVIAEILRQVITLFIGIYLLTTYSWHLTLVMLGSLPIVIVVAIVLGKVVKKYSKATQDSVADSNVIVEETFTAIQSVKAFANEVFELSRYQNKTNEARVIAMKGVFARAGMSSFIIFGIFGAFTLVMWQAAKLIETGELSTGDLATFLILTIFVGASLGSSADLFARLQKGVGATESLFGIFAEEPEKLELISDNNKEVSISGTLAFNQVNFTYPSRPDVPVLKEISFRAKQGETIALVGSSGSGKSTITSLLFRFYDRDTGDISVDGNDINSIPLTSLRNQMAIVPQEVILFGGTIQENIAYGNPNASIEEIRDAAKKANAIEFIDQFPDGLDTLVGERGVQLSGGQKQRIAIARAVLKNPKILILDEATSSLDSESERLVQEALDKLMVNRTSIVIAHRLSTIRKADQILVMQKGQIIESGTHDELTKIDKGVYQNLHLLQLENA